MGDTRHRSKRDLLIGQLSITYVNMSDRLPPLTSLRAFEAAARHMSFAKAAEELNVTPAALSFQIKSLEEHVGQPVFRRLNRAVELTDVGRALAPGLTNGFGSVRQAWLAARRITDTQTLTVTAGPAFTAKWLAPKLFQFAQDHPEIELRFAASLRLMNFDVDAIDCAIRFGYGPDEGLFSTPIIREWVTPMMSPDMAEGMTLADLKTATLLHQTDTAFIDPPIDWAAYFRAAGLGNPPEHGPRFSQADHAVDAAASGGGVVLGRYALAQKELADGRLVAPFALAITTEAHYRFVCPLGAETRPQVKAFLDWVQAETQTGAHLREGRTFVAAADIPRQV